MTETTCTEFVRRGGPSSGGGYDRMNMTRTEVCGKPVVEGTHRCKFHTTIAAKRAATAEVKWRARVSSEHRKGLHAPGSIAKCPVCIEENEERNARLKRIAGSIGGSKTR